MTQTHHRSIDELAAALFPDGDDPSPLALARPIDPRALSAIRASYRLIAESRRILAESFRRTS